jgi:hypothetical protein
VEKRDVVAVIDICVSNVCIRWRADNDAVKALQLNPDNNNNNNNNNNSNNSNNVANTQPLTDAVLRLGAVTDAKRVLDMHTNLTWCIAQQLTERYEHSQNKHMLLQPDNRSNDCQCFRIVQDLPFLGGCVNVFVVGVLCTTGRWNVNGWHRDNLATLQTLIGRTH